MSFAGEQLTELLGQLLQQPSQQQQQQQLSQQELGALKVQCQQGRTICKRVSGTHESATA